jgi:hypothetical protein
MWSVGPSPAAVDEDMMESKNRERKQDENPENRKPDDQCGIMRNTLVFSHSHIQCSDALIHNSSSSSSSSPHFPHKCTPSQSSSRTKGCST